MAFFGGSRLTETDGYEGHRCAASSSPGWSLLVGLRKVYRKMYSSTYAASAAQRHDLDKAFEVMSCPDASVPGHQITAIMLYRVTTSHRCPRVLQCVSECGVAIEALLAEHSGNCTEAAMGWLVRTANGFEEDLAPMHKFAVLTWNIFTVCNHGHQGHESMCSQS